MKKLLTAILWLLLGCELRIYWKENHEGKGIVLQCLRVETRFSLTHLRFPEEEVDYRDNQGTSKMFFLDKVKWGGESRTKPSIPSTHEGEGCTVYCNHSSTASDRLHVTNRIWEKAWDFCVYWCQME